MRPNRLELSKGVLVASALVAAIAGGCGGRGPGHEPVGRLRASLSAAAPDDVTAVAFAVVESDETCDAPPIVSVLLPLGPSASGADAGAPHAGVATVFVLSPGSYRVCATPMGANGQPSTRCARAEAVADVIAGATTEVGLVSQCGATPGGGIDTIITFNDPPRISGLTLPSPGSTDSCQPVPLRVTASDPDGDGMSFAWTLVDGPTGARFDGDGASVQLVARAAGDYQIKVTVTDDLGGASSLVFTVHVADGGACGDGGAGTGGAGGAAGAGGAGGGAGGTGGALACPTLTEFDLPSGASALTAGPDHNLWLASNASIIRLTTAGVSTIFPAELAGRPQIIVGPDGNLWWDESPAYFLGRITPDGVITRFSVIGATGISTGPDGNVWYTVSGSSQLNRITPSGQLWGRTLFRAVGEIVFTNGGFWGTTGTGIGFVTAADAQPAPPTSPPAPVALFPTSSPPVTVTAGQDGTVWFTTRLPPGPTSSVMLGRISPSGALQEFLVGGTTASRPAVAPDGSAWTLFESVFGGFYVARFTPAGNMTLCPLASRGEAIALGPDQRMWFTEPSVNRVATFTP